MKKIAPLFFAVLAIACQNTNDKQNENKHESEEKRKEISLKAYPEVREDSIVDNYFGTIVADPYRWLENDTSEETAAWVKAQNEVTFDYLSQIPYRAEVRDRLEELWNYEKAGTPFKKGEYYFIFKNDGIQNQSVLYYKKGLGGEEKILLDPNTMSEDGTTALNGIGISKDAKYIAYGISQAGSDWVEIHVKEIASEKKLADVVKWVKFSGITWMKDGFYYSAYKAPEEGSEYSGKNEYHKVYYHQLGTDQEEDRLVYEEPNHPLRNVGAGITEDERFLSVLSSESTSGNTLSIKDLKKKDSKFVELIGGFDYESSVIDHLGDGKLLLFTNYNAPNNKVVMVDIQKPDTSNWKDVIPEKKYVLRSAQLTGDKIVASYMKDVKSKLEIYNLEGKYLNDIQLPGIGIASFNGKKEDSTAFYSFSSYVYPTTIFKYNINNNSSEIFFQPEIDFDTDLYETKQVFVESRDGTQIPMFITSKKGIILDGSHPTFLYGYGGFNISVTPSFSTVNTLFLEQGGIYAVVNMRGGSEYGEEWHKGGWRDKKQNVFNDFIAAAEYLIENKYTSTEKLAIHGRSNGGLLVGAVMTQRPDLMKVALPGVGVMDMLRFHKFTIGWAWVGEYGSSEQDQKSFENLYSYSPLHNIKDSVEYPATLVTTADHDDRVVPAHSFKFISELQKKQTGDNPVLIRVDVDAGHGAGKPTSKIIEEWADIWSFVFWNLNVDVDFNKANEQEL